MNKKVLIGLSWVYANGRLHIGHLGSSLPADALARFHRLIGNDVSFITGSDCYGTPILVESIKEGVSAEVLALRYHELLKADFESLDFSFDNYTLTMSAHHNAFAKKFHSEMYAGKYVYEKSALQLYCPKCRKYLPDRYVEGTCPHCGKHAKGDSCDGCGKILEPEDLINPQCKLCGATPEPKNTKQLYLKLSALQKTLRAHFDKFSPSWTINAQGLAGRYLDEGLHDRAITRNIEWGIAVPEYPTFTDEDYAEKRIYIWAENVLGYLSATQEFCEKTGRDYTDFLFDKDGDNSDKLHYYVHAKDNIPFHALILPGLMLANTAHKYHKPDIILASEYLTIEGKKVSKSAGTALTASELIERFDTDLLRFYFLKNMNDRKDVNFTFADFVTTVNGELINNFGNLVNRTLSFVKSKLGGNLRVTAVNPEIIEKINATYNEVSTLMTSGKVNKALSVAMELVNFGNKYFDTCAPWISIKTNREACERSIFEVTTIFSNLAKILEPFIPKCAKKIQKWLEIPTDKFELFTHAKDIVLPDIEILFARLDIAEVKKWFSQYI